MVGLYIKRMFELHVLALEGLQGKGHRLWKLQ
jgi:hypothetical protein